MAVASEKCQKCGQFVHPILVQTGRLAPPWQYTVGGCDWFNGEFLCPDCMKETIEIAAKSNVPISLYFKAMNNSEKVF